jgi:hypothetical protein
MGVKQKQDLAPLMRLPSGYWQHAVELRFLVSEGALPPLNQAKSLKNKKAHILPVPEGHVLHVNLLIGESSSNSSPPLPPEFMPAANALWRTRLRDGRTAVLIGRVLMQSEENVAQIRYIRSELKPTVTFNRSGTGAKQVEAHHLHWSPTGGNVVTIVPMGQEAFRYDDESPPTGDTPTVRAFRAEAQQCDCAIAAPDGRQVARVGICEIDDRFELTKGVPVDVMLGYLKMELLVENLVSGSRFVAAPVKLAQALRIGGRAPQSWAYTFRARFDGLQMTFELLQLSAGLRNRGPSEVVAGLSDAEEVTLTAPKETLRTTVTLAKPQGSVAISGILRLRSQ